MPQQPSEIDRLLVDYTNRKLDEEADRQGVPRDFVRRIAGAESTNRPDVISGRRRSSAGAIGKMQLMPGTARDLGVDPDNVDDNIRGGVTYAKQQLDAFGGDWEKAAAAYNAGPGAVKRYGGVPPYKETQDYVRKVAGSGQGASEIDRLYEQFVGQQPSAAPQYDDQGRRKIGARDVGITPAEGMRFDLSGGAPQIPAGKRKLRSVGPRVGPQPAPGSFEEARANVSRLTSQISPEAQERLRKIEEFERQPLSTQIGERAYDALARGGAEVSRLGRRAIGAGIGAAQALQGGKLENVDVRPEALKRWEEKRQRELAERRQKYRPSLAGDIGEGILEGAGPAAVAGLAGAATGGGTLAALGTGGAISALGADWNNPRRALTQTALGAVAPVVGGRAGSAVAGRVAERLAGPAAQVATRIAGEVGGGAAGNVLQSGAEQAVFEGRIDPRELAKQAVIGGALSAPGALSVGSRPSRPLGRATPESLPAPTAQTVVPERAQAPTLQAQEPAPRAVRPGTKEITPEFRANAQRQALELMGLSPSQIEVEMQRRAPSPAEPIGQTARPPEPVREPAPQTVEQPASQPKPLSVTEQRAQERARLYDVSRNVAGRSMDVARQAIDSGDFGEASARIEAGRRALRDQLRFAPADAPGERARLQREITRAGAMLDQMKAQGRQAARSQRRLESQPTRGITAPRSQTPAQPSPQSAIRNPQSSPLLGSVVNPEGGVPRAPEALSGRFGALARRQVAEGEAAPQSRRKDTGQLSPIEYLKRKTRGQGIRVSDRGEAAVLGAKEAGIVGLTNRRSKWTANDAAVMLDEGGFTLADGRAFTDPSVTENDVLTFLGAGGKQGRPGTAGLEQRLADEEAEYYARIASEAPQTGQGIRAGSIAERSTTGTPAPRRTPPAPLSPRRPGQRVGVPEPSGRGRQSETGALEEVGDFFGEMAREETPKTVTHRDPAINGKPVIAETADGKVVVANPDNKSGVSVVKNRGETSAPRGSLETAYRKLGTDDPEIISRLLRDADKRFKKSATPDEMDAAQSAWAKVQRLTSDEQQALSRVIPQRTFAPVRSEYQGAPGERYGRSVEDVPRSEPNAQLDKNLNDLLGFFDEVTGKPKLVSDAAQRLKDAASGKRAGSGAEQLVDMTIVAGWKAYKAGMDFATWSADVVKQVGERVRPHLERVWREITENFSVGPLPRRRADVERSPRFQQWFKDSKVVDEEGRPLVVYHGTPSSFDTFDPAKIKQGGSLGPGVYIAENPYTANQYISGYNVGADVSKSPNIMPLYLSMRKPLDVEAPLLDRARVARLIPKEDAADLPDSDKVSYFEVIDAVGDKRSQDVAKRLGYDGLVMNLDSGRVWLALDPKQIKSATGNRGTFDTSSGSILGGGLGSLQPMFERGKSSKTGQPTETGSRRGRASETIGGLQTAAQLGNPRFVIRNVLQHVAYGKQERGAMRLAAALDWAFSQATGKGRQIAAPRGSDLASYVRNWGKAIDAYKKGQPLPGKPNADYITADANKLDKAVGKVMAWINEIPDAANWQTRFESSLKSIVEASKRSKAPYDVDDMVDQAWMEANRAALRDKNFVSQFALKIKQALNTASSPLTGTDKWGLGDFVLKYAQTPGALLKRGLERSPLGLFQVAKEAATSGPFRRRNTLLALSRVAEGAATGMGLGAALGAAGVLVGPEEEDRTGKALEREEGVRGYSLNASALRRLLTGESTEMREGDTLYSIDWLQPWAMNLSAGAALYNLHKRGKLGAGSAAGATGEAVYNSLAKTLDVMGDQSVLKNLSRYMSRAQGETFSDKMLSFAREIGLDVPSSFVPSVARQARQVLDPYERDTRAENRSGVRGFVSEAKNRALSQLPGASQAFPKRPSLLTGQDRKTALGQLSVPARIAAQFSPANISTYAPQPVAREISRLNNAGEKVSVTFPRPLGEKETGKRGYREPTTSLRSRERQFADAFASTSRELIRHPDYVGAADATKAAAINNLANYLRTRTRKEIDERTIGDIIERAARGVERRKEKNQ